MSDKLRFLIKLADDDSTNVREKVAIELRDLHLEIDDGLWQEIERQGLSLTATQTEAVREALTPALPDPGALIELAPASTVPLLLPEALPSEAPTSEALPSEAPTPEATPSPERLERADVAFRRAWRHWLHSHHQSRLSEMQRLEEAFDLLARWQLGNAYTVRLTNLLDRLAMEYMERGQIPDYHDLAVFLFIEKGLTGSVAEDYYNPANSNLVQVIESGQGLPISLACVFMMVAERLDLTVHGCNFPNHFLARVQMNNRDLVFDCFNGGRVLNDSEVAALRKAAPDAMTTPATSFDIITRVLNNLCSAYHYIGESSRTEFVLALLNDLRQTDPHSLQD